MVSKLLKAVALVMPVLLFAFSVHIADILPGLYTYGAVHTVLASLGLVPFEPPLAWGQPAVGMPGPIIGQLDMPRGMSSDFLRGPNLGIPSDVASQDSHWPTVLSNQSIMGIHDLPPYDMIARSVIQPILMGTGAGDIAPIPVLSDEAQFACVVPRLPRFDGSPMVIKTSAILSSSDIDASSCASPATAWPSGFFMPQSARIRS